MAEIRKAYETLKLGIGIRIKIKLISRILRVIVLLGFVCFWLRTTKVLLREINLGVS
jgi:hypothetical protein